MDDVITRIKDYVLIAYPTIKTDLSIDDAFIEFMVNDVVDRALIFMNRDQLVEQYEEDLVDYTDPTDDFWDEYEYPIPARLERVLARIVIQSTKTILNNNTADVGAISSASDNGQSVSYQTELASFFGSSDDSKVFSSSLALLTNYRLAGVTTNDSTFYVQDND